jgi:hypothetical protein
VEEWPRFTAWTTRYASDRYTAGEYRLIHLTGIAGSLLAALVLARVPNRALTFLVFAFVVLPALVWNVLFHAGATIVFQAYCPGVITALALYPPVAAVVGALAVREGRLSLAAGAGALVLGGIFHLWEVGHDVFKAW